MKLEENFNPDDPWANKDVWVENKGDNPVIVRVRFEEFYDLEYRSGTEYNIKEGYSQGNENGSAIFKVPGPSTLADNLTADSSTGIDKNVILKFGENGTGVTTMEKWNAMDANAKAAVKWVIDTDGWCYYTKALLYGDKTSYLLNDVDFNEDLFLESHSKPYNLDYKINVRLQAISADLEDFGSHLNDMQWTNVAYIDDNGTEVRDDKGRVIAEDNRADDYEILDDSTITNNAMALVAGISGEFRTLYSSDFRNADGSVAVLVSTAQELNAAINNPDVHSILLTDNIVIDDDTFFGSLYVYQDLLIDLGEYSITSTTSSNSPLFYIMENAKLSIKHGNVETNNQSFGVILGNLTLVGVDINVGSNYGICLYSENSSLEMYGSSIDAESSILLKERADGSSIYLNNTSINSTLNDAIKIDVNGFDNAPQNVSFVIENNSHIESAENGISVATGWTLDAKDSTIIANGAGWYGISENHDYPPKYVKLENCTIKATKCYYKAADSKLIMKNCTLDAVGFLDPEEPLCGYCSTGICVRGGDVTLDNVDITSSQGTFPDGDWMRSQDELRGKYNLSSSLDGFYANFEAMQILLNQYENINLNIIGGSYSATYAGHNEAGNTLDKNAVFIYDNGASIKPSNYPYNNTITISGNPKFSPETSAFDQDYAHTTIAKN